MDATWEVDIWTVVAAVAVFAAGYLLGRGQSRGDPSRLGRARRRDRADNTVVRRPRPHRESGALYDRVAPARDASEDVRAHLAAGRTIEAIKALRQANPDMTLEDATKAVRAYMQRRG